jgi:hypothetical protein
MIYGYSPHTDDMTALLISRGLPCLRRSCGCVRTEKR